PTPSLPTASFVPPTASFVAPPTDRPAAGRGTATLPGYEILGILGRGGMGVVYEARDIQLGRRVALKMILGAEHADPGDLRRFQTEARALAQTSHPNIVQIYEVGEHNGLPFLALEYCDGGSLARKVNGNPLPPREAGRLVETLARAMHAAHLAGIIHRDLKPANILLAGGSAWAPGRDDTPPASSRGSSPSATSVDESFPT